MILDAPGGIGAASIVAAMIDAGADADFIDRAVDNVRSVALSLGDGQDLRRFIASQPGLRLDVQSRSIQILDPILVAAERLQGIPPPSADQWNAWLIEIVAFAAASIHQRVDAIFTGPVMLSAVELSRDQPEYWTAEVMRGGRVAWREASPSRTTPVGAAIVRAMGGEPTICAMNIESIGYAPPDRDTPTGIHPLRVVIGSPIDIDATHRSVIEHDTVVVMQTQMDDCTGERLAVAHQRIMDGGAMDCYFTPIQMKKGRPGVLLTAIASDDHAEAVRDAIFHHTPTIGIRCQRTRRDKLARREVIADHPSGRIVRGKAVTLPDGSTRIKYESDDLVNVSLQTGDDVDQVNRDLRSQ